MAGLRNEYEPYVCEENEKRACKTNLCTNGIATKTQIAKVLCINIHTGIKIIAFWKHILESVNLYSVTSADKNYKF